MVRRLRRLNVQRRRQIADLVCLCMRNRGEIGSLISLSCYAFLVLEAISGQIPIREAIEGAFEASSASVEEQQTTLEEWFANWARLGWLCPINSTKRDG